MTESVDRLGVDVEVIGFSSFEAHMRRVNELLTDFINTAPNMARAGDTVAEALKKVKRALGGSGMSDEIKTASATTQAAMNKMGVASTEAAATAIAANDKLIAKLKEVEAENKKLTAAKPPAPDVTAIRDQLKQQIGAVRRQMETVLEEANARMATLGSNPQALATFDNLRTRLETIGTTIDALNRKRTIIDPTMVTQVADFGKQIGKMATNYQKDFDRIAKVQSDSAAKMAAASKREMEGAIQSAERQLRRFEEQGMSRIATSTLPAARKGELTAGLANEVELYHAAIQRLRQTGGPVQPQDIQALRDLRQDIQTSMRSFNDMATSTRQSANAVAQFSSVLESARNRLDNLMTRQASSIKAANLDEQQIGSITTLLRDKYASLQTVLSSLESRKGQIISADDIKEAEQLGVSITRLNTEISALVSETAKANRIGLDDRFARDSRTINDYLENTALARQRSMAGMSFMAKDNETILQQINASTTRERQRYQEILARSAEMGSGESIKALKRLREDTIRETVAINEAMERLSIQGAVRRRALVTENISPQDFATGVIQRAVEGQDALLAKLARTFFSLEEGVSRGTTRWNAFLNVLQRGRTIIDYYLSPLYVLRDIFNKMTGHGATRAIRDVGVEAGRSTGIIRGMIDALAAVTRGTGRAISGAVSAAASGASSLFARKPRAESALPGVDRSMAQAAEASSKLAANIDKANAPATKLSGTFAKIVNELWGTGSMTAKLGADIANSLTNAFRISFGFNFINIVSNAMQTVRGMISQAFTSIGDQQALVTQFGAAITNELMESGQFRDMGSAMEAATEKAQELYEWTENLAILSPFGQDDISQITRFLQVGGLATEQVKSLTGIIVDSSTGLGLAGDKAALLGKAFSDVLVKGKLAGQEVLQFANAGVPVMRLLAQLTGKSLKELNEYFSAGGLLEAGDAVRVISDYLGNRFAGAAEKAAFTARGLANTLGDLRTKALREFSTPIFERVIAPIMSTMADALQNDDMMAQIRQMGESVAEAMSTVVYWVSYGFGLFQSAIAMVNPLILDFIKYTALFLATDTVWAILWSLAVPAVMALGAALSGLMTWYGLYTVASAALVVAWQRDWMGIATITTEFINVIIDAFNLLTGRAKKMREESGSAASGWRSTFFQMLDMITQTSKGIYQILSVLASDMITWGGNLVSSLADGMMAAINTIVDALMYVGDVVATWLMPGSPPKLLPDLTKWGTGAADAWLEGWTKADFDTLSEISGSISSALESIGENVDTTELGKINSAIAGAISSIGTSGTFDMEEVMGGLTMAVDRFGEISEEVRRMAGAQLQAAAAQSKLTKAQDELNAATARYDDQLSSVNDEIAELDRQLSAIDTSSQAQELGSVLKNRFATEKQQTVASLKLQKMAAEQRQDSLEAEKGQVTKTLQTKVDALQAEYDKTQAVLGVTEARYKIEFDAIKAITELRTSSMSSSAAATDMASKAQDRLNDAILAYRMQLADTPGKIALMKEELKKHEKGSVEYYEILTKIVGLEQQWEREKEAAAKKAGKDAPLRLAESAGEAQEKIEGAKNKIGEAMDQLREKVDTAMGDAKTAVDNVTKSWNDMNTAFGAGINGQPIQQGATIVNQAVYGIGIATGIVGVVWENFKLGFTGAMPTPDSTPVKSWSTTVGGYISSIKDSFDGVIAYLQDFGGRLQRAFNSSLVVASTDPTGMIAEESTFARAIRNVGKLILEEFKKLDLVNKVKKLLGFGGEGEAGEGTGIIATVQAQLDLHFGETTFDLSGAAGKIQKALEDHPWTVIGIAGAIVTALAAAIWGVGPIVATVVAALSSAVWSMTAVVESILGGLSVAFAASSLLGIAGILLGGIAIALIGANWTQISSAGQNIIDEVGKAIVTGDFSGLSSKVMDVIKNAFTFDSFKEDDGSVTFGSVVKGTRTGLGAAETAVSGFISNLVSSIGEMFSNFDFAAGGFSVGFFAVNLASSIFNIITGIDWFTLLKGLFSATSQFIIGLTGGILAGIVSIDWNETLRGAWTTFTDAVAGMFAGLFDGIFNVLPGWVQDLLSGDSSVPASPEEQKGQIIIDEANIGDFSDGRYHFPVTAQIEEAAIGPELPIVDIPVAAIVDELDSKAAGKTMGENIAAGQVDGMTTALTSAETKAKTEEANEGLWGWLKSWWETESPSKKAHDGLGVLIGQGLIGGIATALGAADLTEAFTGLMEKMKAAFSGVQAGGGEAQQQAQGQATGIASAILGNLEGLDLKIAAIFESMNVAVNRVMLQMTDDLTETTEEYVEDSTELIEDYYEWTEDATKENSKTVTDLFSGMRTAVIAIVKDLVVKSTAEFGKIKDAFKEAARAAIDAAVLEFKEGAERLQDAIEGVIGDVAGKALAEFEAQGKKLGKALADGIVSAFKGADANNFITALAAAIQSAVNQAVAEATENIDVPSSGGGSTTTPPATAPVTPRPPGEIEPRSLLLPSGRTTQNLLDLANFLAPLQQAGLFGVNTQSNLTPAVAQLANGSTIIYNTNYNIYQTVTPEQAVRVDQSFKLFEAKNRR